MYFTDQVLSLMMAYYRGDPGQIQHFVKVHSFAAGIGRGERLDEKTQLVLEIAALVHDIGIRPALEQFGSSAGPLQEKLGAPAARELLGRIGFPEELTERVCYLVSRHHTYTDVDGLDYRILLEADYLVNCYESSFLREAAAAAVGRVFQTDTGIRYFRTMYDLEESV